MIYLEEISKTSEEIYELIVNRKILSQSDPRKYVYLIDGNRGATGKSWLEQNLRKQGFRAIDISENPYKQFHYINRRNYVGISEDSMVITIALNKPLDLKKGGIGQ